MVKLNMGMTRNETIKAAATSAAAAAFAIFFYSIFNPADIPAVLTYVIFFVLPPSYAAYCAIDYAVNRLAHTGQEKTAAE